MKRSSSAVTTFAEDAQSLAAQLPALLKELVEIAGTDGLLKEAEQSAPQGAEAQKWHEISCRALRWSRDALGDRQANILARMKELVQDSSSRVRVVPAEPARTPTPKPSWLNID